MMHLTALCVAAVIFILVSSAKEDFEMEMAKSMRSQILYEGTRGERR